MQRGERGRAGASTSSITLPDLSSAEKSTASVLPQRDALDVAILKFWLPGVASLCLIPIVQTLDVICVGRLGDASSLAALGASNQVFMSTVWIISFLSTLVSPAIAEAAGRGDTDALRQRLGEALVVSFFVGSLATICICIMPGSMMHLVGYGKNKALSDCIVYLRVRAATLIPQVSTLVCFACFRGIMDSVTPLRVGVMTQIVKASLGPLLIFGVFGLKRLGIVGVAVASSCGELLAFAACITVLVRRRYIDFKYLSRAPPLARLKALFVGGAAVQIRSFVLNLVFLTISRRVIQLDATGTVAAAHAIVLQFTQLGLLIAIPLGGVAAVIVPQYLNGGGGDSDAASGGEDENDGGDDDRAIDVLDSREAQEVTRNGSSSSSSRDAPSLSHDSSDAKIAHAQGTLRARHAADRMICWGVGIGLCLGLLQVLMVPLVRVVTPLPEVQAAAIAPFFIASSLQGMNGITFVSEGILQGHRKFAELAAIAITAVLSLLMTLKFADGLVGIWLSFFVFSGVRMSGALIHHFFIGPLSNARVREAAALL